MKTGKTTLNKILIFISVAFISFLYQTGAAYAALEQIMVFKSVGLLKSVVGIVFIMGGFGLVGLTVGALFGRIKWRWAACLALGLFIASTALSIVAYMTDDTWFNWNVALTYDANWTGDSVEVTN